MPLSDVPPFPTEALTFVFGRNGFVGYPARTKGLRLGAVASHGVQRAYYAVIFYRILWMRFVLPRSWPYHRNDHKPQLRTGEGSCRWYTIT